MSGESFDFSRERFNLCDNYFKQYNDKYGHLAGDKCLFLVAQTISSQVKHSTELVSRYGGEEFALIFSNIEQSEIIQMVEAIGKELCLLNLRHEASTVSEHITLSFGIASLVPTFSTKPQSLIDRADQALYQAKANGRNGYWLYGGGELKTQHCLAYEEKE
jgi:diguanylate cyclase (GGDEF)-like protein